MTSECEIQTIPTGNSSNGWFFFMSRYGFSCSAEDIAIVLAGIVVCFVSFFIFLQIEISPFPMTL